MPEPNDWNPTQYLQFEDERTRPCHDLVSRIPLQSPRHIIDLGCGPGNSTAVLAERFPQARLSGVDSSPDMISKARDRLPETEFSLADLNSYTPPETEPVDLFISNAVLHWLPSSDRINVMLRLLRAQKPGGVFAFQVPDNLAEPSHAAMRETALNGPWTPTLESLGVGVGRDSFQSPREIYDHLKPVCSRLDFWHTTYYHVLDGHGAIVEWLKGSGLRPFLDPLSEDDRQGFLDAYLRRLQEVYPVCQDGTVILPFPRFFMVAVKG